MGSGLFIRTLRNTMSTDLGFDPRGAAAARFNLGLLQYGPEQTAAFVDDLLSRLRGLPQVEAAGVATLIPFQGGGFRGTFAEIPAYDAAPDEEIRFDFLAVTPGYFEALGMRAIEGRTIAGSDVEGTRAVAVINRLAAERYWPTGNAIGGAMTMGGSIELEVVGVVENPTWRQVGEIATPFVFLSMRQFPTMGGGGFLTMVARTGGTATTLVPAMRAQFRAVEPGRFSDWHTAPRRQYVITLSGEVEIGLGDGSVHRYGPGHVNLAEDLTGQGHTTRAVGDVPRVTATIHLDD